jgi:sporulation protein YlmC with PRC-barrel domain
MLKKLALISAASTFAIGAALAQAPSPTSPSPPAATETAPKADATGTTGGAQFVSSQKPEQFLASKFRGTDVIGSENEKIGDITDILFDKNGKIEAYIVSVGGFLGIGAKDVALAPSQFQVMPAEGATSYERLKLSMSKEQLQQAASFEPYSPPVQRQTTGTGGPGGSAPRPTTGTGN